MKRRIALATLLFLGIEAAVVGLGLQMTEPFREGDSKALVSVALTASPGVLDVGQKWTIDLTVANTTKGAIRVAPPELGRTVDLAIEWEGNTPELAGKKERASIVRIHPDLADSEAYLDLGPGESQTFTLLEVPAPRVGRYTLSATYTYSPDRTPQATPPEDVSVSPHRVEDREIDRLYLEIETSAVPEGTLRMQFLASTGLTAAIHFCDLATRGRLDGKTVAVAGEGLRFAPASELESADIAAKIDRSGPDEEKGETLGLVLDDYGLARSAFDLSAPGVELENHARFAELVGGQQHVEPIRRALQSGETVTITRIGFRPQPDASSPVE